ncbi:hypothetical protein Hdeb2414_s0004g00140791 [Helianthus debilis subsp. tardiflorus]
MATIENQVCGLERMVDDMACNLLVSVDTLRCYNNGFHISSKRPFGKYNGYSNYHTHGPNTQMGWRRAVNNRLISLGLIDLEVVHPQEMFGKHQKMKPLWKHLAG